MGTLKKYIANTQVSVNIVLPSGKSTRISFNGNTMGRSAFYTSDPDIQSGLEHHYKFGSLFKLDNSFEEPKKNAKRPKKKPENIKKEVESENAGNGIPEPQPIGDIDYDGASEEPQEDGEKIPETKEMTFSDYGSAKEYLCQSYGIARTKLKTQESITEAALSFGITLNIE